MTPVRIALVLLVLAGAARADDCTFPTPIDTIPRQQPWNLVLPVLNRMICVVNKLEQWAVHTPPSEVACATATIPAGERTTVNLTAASALVGSEVILPKAKEASDPPMLIADGTATPGGAAVKVYVFNRDATAARTGTICAHIVRP